MYNNSIIAFTTDNGGPANGFDGNVASNFPLSYIDIIHYDFLMTEPVRISFTKKKQR